MARFKISDDPEIAVKQMALELANNSIVNKALARYIEQILEAVNEDTIQPLRDEIERLQKVLYRIIDLDHHNMGPESQATKIARAALSDQRGGNGEGRDNG